MIHILSHPPRDVGWCTHQGGGVTTPTRMTSLPPNLPWHVCVVGFTTALGLDRHDPRDITRDINTQQSLSISHNLQQETTGSVLSDRCAVIVGHTGWVRLHLISLSHVIKGASNRMVMWHRSIRSSTTCENETCVNTALSLAYIITFECNEPNPIVLRVHKPILITHHRQMGNEMGNQ